MNIDAFTLKAQLSVLEKDDAPVTLRFTKDAYAVVDQNDIDPRFLFPLSAMEDPEGEGKRHLIKIKKGAKVTLHYKTLSHTFTLDPDRERNFVIDEDNLRVLYVNEHPELFKKLEQSRGCYKFVVIYQCHCCGSGRYVGEGFGLVGCNNRWHDDRCCA
jgi:hypothetical protein